MKPSNRKQKLRFNRDDVPDDLSLSSISSSLSPHSNEKLKLKSRDVTRSSVPMTEQEATFAASLIAGAVPGREGSLNRGNEIRRSLGGHRPPARPVVGLSRNSGSESGRPDDQRVASLNRSMHLRLSPQQGEPDFSYPRVLSPQHDELSSSQSSENSGSLEEGTDDPTEDDTDSFMVDYLARRDDRPTEKTMVLGNTTAWYGPEGDNGSSGSPRRELSGPFGLVIRQVREGRLAKWETVESLPIDNKSILDDEDIVFELDRVRVAAQSDIHAVIEIALDLWQSVLQKADDLDRLQADNEELELQRRGYENTIQSLEEKVSANAALWQNKFKSALDELDETEQKLNASKQAQRLQQDDSSLSDEAMTGENMYEAYLENLQLIQTLKGEKARLKRALADATAQIDLLTATLRNLEQVDGKFASLQTKYSAASTRLLEAEKMNNVLLQDLDDSETKILTLQDAVDEYHKKLEEMSRHLNDRRESQEADEMETLNQTMGVCLFSELLTQQGSEEALQVDQLPPIAEDREPRELSKVVISPVVIVETEELHLSTQQGTSINKDPESPELSVHSATDVNLPPDVKEVVSAVTQTVQGVKQVDVQQIGNQIHIHLHQHQHDHGHQHTHNHDHYHSYARQTPDPQTAEVEEPISPPKEPIVWSRVRVQKDSNADPTKPSYCSSLQPKRQVQMGKFVNYAETPAVCNTVGSTKLKSRMTPNMNGKEDNFATAFIDGMARV